MLISFLLIVVTTIQAPQVEYKYIHKWVKQKHSTYRKLVKRTYSARKNTMIIKKVRSIINMLICSRPSHRPNHSPTKNRRTFNWLFATSTGCSEVGQCFTTLQLCPQRCWLEPHTSILLPLNWTTASVIIWMLQWQFASNGRVALRRPSCDQLFSSKKKYNEDPRCNIRRQIVRYKHTIRKRSSADLLAGKVCSLILSQKEPTSLVRVSKKRDAYKGFVKTNSASGYSELKRALFVFWNQCSGLSSSSKQDSLFFFISKTRFA